MMSCAHVRLVVAVGVLEEKEARRLADDEPAIGERQAGRDVQLVGEDGELVRLAVAIGVLADLDAVIALAAGRHAVRIVAASPPPSSGRARPRPRRWVCMMSGSAGEEFQPQVRRDLGALHAALHAERMLEGERLRARLVVGHVRIGLALLRLALGEEGLPFRPAGGPGGGEEFFLQRLRNSAVPPVAPLR